MATPRKNPEDLLPAGRPTMYDRKFCEEIIEFFDIEPYREITTENKNGTEITKLIANDLPTMAGFASHIGVSKPTLVNWGKAHPEFFAAITRAKTIAEKILVANTLQGLYEPRFAVFVAKNYTDLKDAKEIINRDGDSAPTTPDEVEQKIADLDKQIEALQGQL